MCCSSGNGKIDADALRQKEGSILKYESGCCGGDWKRRHFVLYSDSRLCWFKNKESHDVLGCVLLKDVTPYICVGLMTDKMPAKQPSIPNTASRHLLVGIGIDQKASTVYWLLFSTASDIESWFVEISKTLPPPPPPPVPPTSPSGNQLGPPPPAYQGPSRYNNNNGPPMMPPGQSGSTGGGGGGDGMLTGVLLGSMLGFGMGSFFGGPMGFYGAPLGMGGFGGAFVSNNDTTVTNNYYGEPPPEASGAPDGQQGESAPENAPNENGDYGDHGEMTDYGDGGGYGNDYGGGEYQDYGGYDTGGGYDYGGFDGGDYGGDF